MHSLWLPSKQLKSLGLIAGATKKRRKPIPAAQKITAKGQIVVTNKLLTAKQIFTVATEIAKLVADMYGLLYRIEDHRKAGGTGPVVT